MPSVHGLTCAQEDRRSPIQLPLDLHDGLRNAEAALHDDPVRGCIPDNRAGLHVDPLQVAGELGQAVQDLMRDDQDHTVLWRRLADQLRNGGIDQLLCSSDALHRPCEEDLRMLRDRCVQNEDVRAALRLERLQLKPILPDDVGHMPAVHLHCLHIPTWHGAMALQERRSAGVVLLKAELAASLLHQKRRIVLCPFLRTGQGGVRLSHPLKAGRCIRVVMRFVGVVQL
mmetsp:Transcript_29441/g.84630  ORF Transcript_29441/g.84630 Transcript_29441/m.84630 type:complete len:228 (+) Transcript_29441:4064-4747(+)